jgi:heat shock protein HslJ
MKKINKIIIILIVTLLIIIFIFIVSSEGDKNINTGTGIITASSTNIRYIINEEEIILVDGVSYNNLPNSYSTTTTKYFGNGVEGDFDGDENIDTSFLVTQTNSGSGIFYYLVATLNKNSGPVGTYGFFIGDRIAPQSTNRDKNNNIVVNYADRKPGEPFTTSPSIGKSLVLRFDKNTNKFVEVVQNFEGEANPDIMRLNMKTWTWVKTVYNDGTTITPKIANKFNLTFKDKTFSATTDCNGVGGEFIKTNNKQIEFTKMMSTLMFCEGSQEAEFSKSLGEISSYNFTSKGELIMNIKMDSGYMVFR